jgi:ribosomal protein L37AE/L43A
MSGLESLKSLTVKSPSIWGPVNRVPWTDVCISLSKVSRNASKYARLKYAMEYKWRGEILRILYGLALKEKWNKSVTKKDLVTIVNLSLEESLSPAVCPKCNGRKQLRVLDKIYKCDVCLGVGTRSMGDSARARYIFRDSAGSSRMNYLRHVKYNYFNTLIYTIQEWEMELHRSLGKMR